MTIKSQQKSTEKQVILPKILDRRFNKISDPNFSLFENEYRSHNFMKKVSLIFILGGLPLFIVGLILLILGNVLGVIPITFGGLGIMMLIYLPILFAGNSKFNPLVKLREKKDISNLLELAKKYSHSYGYIDQERARLATYLLIDFKSKEIGLLLRDRLLQRNPINFRDVLRSFYLLAIKLGFRDHKALFLALENSTQSGEKVLQVIPTEDNEVVVPITKIYFLDNIPQNAKCMISGLQLDFKHDNIVVCPYCSAWAKKELLESWLSKKKTCPVCRRNLSFSDCPNVQFKSV